MQDSITSMRTLVELAIRKDDVEGLKKVLASLQKKVATHNADQAAVVPRPAALAPAPRPRLQQRVQLLPFHAQIIQPDPLFNVLAKEPRHSQTSSSKAFASLSKGRKKMLRGSAWES